MSPTISCLWFPSVNDHPSRSMYNPFSNLQNLTGNEPTFYNDDTYKLDWIVGKNVVYKHHTLNEIVEDEGRWPNAEEVGVYS